MLQSGKQDGLLLWTAQHQQTFQVSMHICAKSQEMQRSIDLFHEHHHVSLALLSLAWDQNVTDMLYLYILLAMLESLLQTIH